jgi:hypothetical protein
MLIDLSALKLETILKKVDYIKDLFTIFLANRFRAPYIARSRLSPCIFVLGMPN